MQIRKSMFFQSEAGTIYKLNSCVYDQSHINLTYFSSLPTSHNSLQLLLTHSVCRQHRG